jgi:hypothetical protein
MVQAWKELFHTDNFIIGLVLGQPLVACRKSGVAAYAEAPTNCFIKAEDTDRD